MSRFGGVVWDLFYLGRAPWDMGAPRPDLVHLVEGGDLEPCRAIDLGCGTGHNVIYLAQQGFVATGVDISARAIAKARRKADAPGVAPTLLVGDVTDLAGVEGPFDLVLDYGCLHSLVREADREAYVRTVLRLTRPGSRFMLTSFVRSPRGRFRLLSIMLQPGEAERRFGGEFEVEDCVIMQDGIRIGLSRGSIAQYSMRRKPQGGR